MDVVALGELLIDFTPHGVSDQGQPLFERNPGGAPANVLAALAKLGRKTAFIGAVGNDDFGRYLAETLENSGINTSGMVYTDEARTTLAFVQLDRTGDRSFTFYRKPGADQLLKSEDVHAALVQEAKVFHFGSITLTDEPSRTATLKSAAIARRHGALISYDPNLRLSLWRDAEHARTAIMEGLQLADVVKLSEEELHFLTGTSELEKGSSLLMEQYGIALLFVTMGADGSYCRAAVGEAGAVSANNAEEASGASHAENHVDNHADERVSNHVGESQWESEGETESEIRSKSGASFLSARHLGYQVEVADTTGSGDAFFGGALYQLLQAGYPHVDMSIEQLTSLLAFANAMGALTATGKGAIPSLPELDRVHELVDSGN
ncbi:carbohydrate kinase [Paenibacillus sp. J5C_2022]|uniref:carbohydrate kinase family protein n=1 Tax=Paenibacillus sp. J5C2022 TaxID=2977129 RepID=UPI0021D1F7CF|nr:carbohydrate kinase [Paenibacillus sp. J5C2022]MCU6712612.1 carbohydrate kinase [Paenibacillus sp. J5C2022]